MLKAIVTQNDINLYVSVVYLMGRELGREMAEKNLRESLGR